MSSILTVTQLNRYISFKLKDDPMLKGRLVRGEISNFTHHEKSGHFYFSLKDSESVIRVVMFNNFASRVNFTPKSGMSVIVQGSIQVYERDGICQIYATDMQPDGIGALYLAFQQLKDKLSEEGLFDDVYKRRLPAFPEKIGIITSSSGAALQDILNILNRRYPSAKVIVYPTAVQGDEAPPAICRAITMSGAGDCDLLIIARGGGSFEDLNAFNAESVARAVHECRKPIISAIGHETDFTICDFVADLRAPTPSAAAELAVPDISAVIDSLDSLIARLESAASKSLEIKMQQLRNSTVSLLAASPEVKLQKYSERLNMLILRQDNAMQNILKARERQLAEKAEILESLNPLKVLSRGYSLVYKKNSIILDSSELKAGDKVRLKFSVGEASAEIKSITNC